MWSHNYCGGLLWASHCVVAVVFATFSNFTLHALREQGLCDQCWCPYTVGVNIMLPYRLKKIAPRHANAFKTSTVYRFFTFFTAFIRSQFLCVIFRLTPPKSINEKSRTNRLARVKLARREAINRREEHKQSTD